MGRFRHFVGIVAFVLAAGVASADVVAPFGSVFDPGDATSLGSLNLLAGQSVTIDTDTLMIAGDFTGTGELGMSNSGSTTVAVFGFDAISVDAAATVTVTGSRGLALLSTGNISIANVLSLNGSAGGNGIGSGALGGAGGPGADGNGGNAPANNAASPGEGMGGGNVPGNNGGGGGGSYGGMGGTGGRGQGNATGGPIYGDIMLTELLGGSGGASGRGTLAENGAGGGGGGALQLSALGLISISGTVQVDGGNGGDGSDEGGGGGSGGGLIVSALAIDVTGTVSAAGGDGGESPNNPGPAADDGRGGGAGGGGRIAFYSGDAFTIADVDVAGGTATHGATAGGEGSFFQGEMAPFIIPEPTSLALLAVGAATIGMRRRRRAS